MYPVESCNATLIPQYTRAIFNHCLTNTREVHSTWPHDELLPSIVRNIRRRIGSRRDPPLSNIKILHMQCGDEGFYSLRLLYWPGWDLCG